MLSECLVKGNAVRQFLRQPGMRHQTHAVVRILHGARLALRGSRHAHVPLVTKFPNNAIVGAAGAVTSGGADAGTGAPVRNLVQVT